MAATTPGISPHYSPWRSFPDRADQRESIGSPARAGQIPCVLDTIPVFSLAKAVPPRLTLRPAPSCSVICTFAERFRSPRRQNSGPNTRAASACLATSRCRRDTEQAPRQAPLHHPKLQAVQTFSQQGRKLQFSHWLSNSTPPHPQSKRRGIVFSRLPSALRSSLLFRKRPARHKQCPCAGHRCRSLERVPVPGTPPCQQTVSRRWQLIASCERDTAPPSHR